MQIMAIVVTDDDILRPGRADAHGDLRETPWESVYNCAGRSCRWPVASVPSRSSVPIIPSISRCSFRSHLASLKSSEQAIYSASVVDANTRTCCRDCHKIASLSRVNI